MEIVTWLLDHDAPIDLPDKLFRKTDCVGTALHRAVSALHRAAPAL